MHCLKGFETGLAYYFSEVLEYPLAKPYWVYISLSHECTYRCQMCGVVKILKGEELPFETVKKALSEISGWRWDCVVMLTGGEPFLRKDIFDIIASSVRMKLKTEAVSNGALIDKELAERIICSGLQNIAVSLDGARETTHDSIRRKGAFKKALTAIENLAEAKRRAGIGPQISVWSTIMKENIRELFDIIALVKDLGAECLVYHPVIVAQDDMQNTSPDAPFWIKGEDLGIMEDQIGKISAYKSKSGFVAFLHNPYLWVNYFSGTLTRIDWKCNPFVFVNIGPDGELRSCGSSFGNIKELSLSECLASDEAVKARRIMKLCRKPCLQTCWAHPESDSLLGLTKSFIDNLKGDKNRVELLTKSKKILEDYETKVLGLKRCTD